MIGGKDYYMFYTCHCTGEPAYKMMKLSMGEQLQYVHSGDEVVIKKWVAKKGDQHL